MDMLTQPISSPALVTDKHHLDENPAAVYVASLGSETSRRTMIGTLTILARLLTGREDADALTLDWTALRYPHLMALRARLIQSYAPSTANRMLCAVRGVIKHAYRLRLLDGDTYHRLVTVDGVRGERLPSGRALTPDELARLLAACLADETASGVRDAALLAILYAGGLRRAEAAALDVEDVDPIAGRIVIRHGKGNKERVVYVAGGALAALRVWLRRRGDLPGALFVTINKGGVVGDGGMSVTAIYDIVRKRAAQAQIASISPHDLRRTHMSDLLAAGADTLLVARIAGHADPKTTARYDRRPEEASRAAAALLMFPYPDSSEEIS
jgi:integrase